MKFVPYENFYIATSICPQEVQKRLSENTGPSKGLFNVFKSSGKYFEGYVVNNTFELKRNINYKNSFLPVIKGVIEPLGINARVHIKMSLHPAVLVFMCIWLGGAAVAAVAITVNVIRQLGFDLSLLPAYGMFLFGYCLVTLGFKYESNKTRGYLLQLVDGTIEST